MMKDANSPIDQPPPEAPRQDAPGLPAADDTAAKHRTPKTSRRLRYGLFSFLFLLVTAPVFLSLTGYLETVAQTVLGRFAEAPAPAPITAEEVKAPAPVVETAADLKFIDSAYHPDRLFRPYFGTTPDDPSSDDPRQRLIEPFRELLTLFMKRQGEDDNFTIRVYDNRDGTPLELYTLIPEKRAYERTGEFNWRVVDKTRRKHTRRLVEKYEQLGYPKEAISAKWGRRNQVRQAREREAPFIHYEMRLARYLGLSLLATEIGTVETFNQDSLVSSVGARGRYQMMPYILRQSNIHHYKLPTSFGKKIDVQEELHPLLTMEPAFLLLRSYVNAVGHEIPGISAYHTGPGNIFKLYTMFLNEAEEFHTANTTVLDAYIWAVTEGFEKVSSETSFRTHSQGYVPSGYGSLRAVEDLPIDTTLTLEVERVQLKAGQSIYLGDVLTALVNSGTHLRWAQGTSSLSLYERFRHLNPHFALPPAETGNGVPPEGNVLLTDAVEDATVRFFLPLRATTLLKDGGLDVIDEETTFRFDNNTYRLPPESEMTEWDAAYSELIRESARFGFSTDRRRRLGRIAQQFEMLAARNPTHYRLMQHAIIKQHQSLWAYKGWDAVAAASTSMKGTIHLTNVTPRPPDSSTQRPDPTPRPVDRLALPPPAADTSGTQ